MTSEEHTTEALDAYSTCPSCGYTFGGVCYVITFEDGEVATLCDCCVAPNVACATFEDCHGRRGRIKVVELAQ